MGGSTQECQEGVGHLLLHLCSLISAQTGGSAGAWIEMHSNCMQQLAAAHKGTEQNIIASALINDIMSLSHRLLTAF